MKAQPGAKRSNPSPPTIEQRTVFLGGIPLRSTQKEILDYLLLFDSVVSLVMPRDRKTGQLKGYAKVTLATENGVNRILQEAKHNIGGLQVGITKWRSQSEYLTNKDQLITRKIYVKYPSSVSKQQLYEYFKKFGAIREIDLKTDPFTKKDRHFCYVVFDAEQAAEDVVHHKDHTIDDQTLICEMSKPAHLVRKGLYAKQKNAGLGSARSAATEQHPTPPTHDFEQRGSFPRNLSKEGGVLFGAGSSNARAFHVDGHGSAKDAHTPPDASNCYSPCMPHVKPTSSKFPAEFREMIKKNHRSASNLQFRYQNFKSFKLTM